LHSPLFSWGRCIDHGTTQDANSIGSFFAGSFFAGSFFASPFLPPSPPIDASSVVPGGPPTYATSRGRVVFVGDRPDVSHGVFSSGKQHHGTVFVLDGGGARSSRLRLGQSRAVCRQSSARRQSGARDPQRLWQSRRIRVCRSNLTGGFVAPPLPITSTSPTGGVYVMVPVLYMGVTKTETTRDNTLVCEEVRPPRRRSWGRHAHRTPGRARFHPTRESRTEFFDKTFFSFSPGSAATRGGPPRQ
jgi:hypothetical protein